MLVNLPRGGKHLLLLILFALIWALFWTQLSPATSNPHGSAKNSAPERLSIEDAFNDIELQPLPSDIDTASNQSNIDIIVFAKYAYSRMKVPRNLYETIRKILQFASIPLHVHVLADLPSYIRIKRTFLKLQAGSRKALKYSIYDLTKVEREQQSTIKLMRKNFFSKKIERYDDDIFFLTPAFHRVFPKLQRAIFLDTDLQFRADIAELWLKFSEFTKENILGMGHDLQPHYRFEFAKYREKHNNTDVGSARPGKQGLNTGVMLMDFDRMRNCRVYNDLLTGNGLEALCDKYDFHGYLGHQDFFTLLANEYPQMFYLLHCSWNRQLDMSWKAHYRPEIFEQYHRCEGFIRVYHANGGSKVPPDPASRDLN